MSSGIRSRRGFTLIEALVAVVLAGVGVAAVVGAFNSLEMTESKALEKERMVRLAIEKYNEIAALGNITNVGGTFDEKNEDRYVWEATTDTTGVENVTQLTVTVSTAESTGRQLSESVYGVVYEEPASSSTGTGVTP